MYVLVSRSNIKSVEGIQRMFTKRYFQRVSPFIDVPAYEIRLKMFAFVSLEPRYSSQDLVILYKIIKRMMPITNFRVNMSTSRHAHRIIVPSFRTSSFRLSFSHRAITHWNKTIHQMFGSIPTLKSHLYPV